MQFLLDKRRDVTRKGEEARLSRDKGILVGVKHTHTCTKLFRSNQKHVPSDKENQHRELILQ